MATVTRIRTKKQVERKVNISKPVNSTYALHMTIGTGEKAKHFGYYLTPIKSDFGLGFHIEKFGAEQVEGEDAEYDVHIDTQRGYHSCTCKGNTYHGHCKHVEATLALIAAGTIAAKQPPVMVNAEEPMASVLLGGERHRQEMASRPAVCSLCKARPAVEDGLCRDCLYPSNPHGRTGPA